MVTTRSWQQLQELWWIARLKDCPQPPEHHGEGDVLTHLGLVLERLQEQPAYQSLPSEDQDILWNAALLHDVAKPDCTREDGSSPGHSRRGAILAREILWRMDCPPEQRETICSLVEHHMVPFWLLEGDGAPLERLLPLSLNTRCDLLAILAKADGAGRLSDSKTRLLDNVELFRIFCQEQLPARFPSPHSQLHFCRQGGDPNRSVFYEPRSQVTVLSGLPGAGKDTWIAANIPHLPQVSLDSWRERLGVGPGDNQAPVVQAARNQARELLRKGVDFVWNATNLSRDLRTRCIDLLLDYLAEVHLVHLEAPCEELMRRNQQRPHPLPQAAVDRMLGRWEYPHPGEAHRLILP